MTDTSKEAVERLMDGVTPGPWHTTPDGWRVTDKRVTFDDDGVRCGETTNICIFAETEANARFIAAARELVPALLARAEAAEVERDALTTKLARAMRALDLAYSNIESIESGLDISRAAAKYSQD